MTRSIAAVLLLATSLSLTTPSTRNSDPTGFGSAIIEITPPTFDELMRALQMEIDQMKVSADMDSLTNKGCPLNRR